MPSDSPAVYFPLYVALAGKRCVVVGGGAVAERKVSDLREAGAHVIVVSPDITPALQQQAQEGTITWIEARYETSHLESAWLVFAATNSRLVNAQVTRDAQERHLLVNVVDAPDAGDFIVPTVVRRGRLCLSVSTGGSNPLLARKLAQELEAYYGPEYGALVELLGQMRAYTKEKTARPEFRRAALARLVEHEAELRRLLQSGSEAAARQLAESLIEESLIAENLIEESLASLHTGSE